MRGTAIAIAIGVCYAAPAGAVTSSRSVPSSFGGNGHNVTFDGRLYVVRTGIGWQARVLRPEAVTYAPDGLPDANGPMWSASVTILTGPQPELVGENAVALCEDDPARAPYACDEDGGASAGGPYACYDLWIIDSDASKPLEQDGQRFRRRAFQLWVANPRTASAAVHKFTLGAPTVLDVEGGGELHGIEPTVTADGRLMVWNGSLDNGNSTDTLMYSVNETACALGGWSPPASLSHMANDDAVVGTYRLADRTLRASDGTAYADGAAIHGAYPWLLPSGDGVMFSAALMPCRGVEDPPGCGPRRNATAFLGYPTNWGLAVVDGGINPSTTDTVRLFFSSPGPDTFDTLPVSDGVDVWPFFGTNTSNYAEVSFDDGLDGDYAGLWHLNEVVDVNGGLDAGRSGDVSGYFNTASIAPIGVSRDLTGAQSLPGSGAGIAVDDDGSLNPTDVLTLQLSVRPSADPDCNGNNNYRMLLLKGDGATAYSLVLEESRYLQARVFTAGGAEYALFSGRAVPVDEWTAIGITYDSGTGEMVMYLDGSETARQSFAPAALRTSAGPLYVGGSSLSQPACANGFGTFEGDVDDVNVSSDDIVPGAFFPAANNGWLGKAVVLDGVKGWLEVPHAASLEPVNGITMEMMVMPTADPDCDGANNYRTLLAKGESYSLVLEEPRGVRARVRLEGGTVRELYSGAVLPIGAWTHVAAEYDAASGTMAIYFDGEQVALEAGTAGTLAGDGSTLYLGGRGVRAACPDGDGDFAGLLDEVAVSRYARTLGAPPEPVDAGPGDVDGAAGDDDDDDDGGGNPGTGDGGGCCGVGHGGTPASSVVLALVIALALLRPGHRRGRRSPL